MTRRRWRTRTSGMCGPFRLLTRRSRLREDVQHRRVPQSEPGHRLVGHSAGLRGLERHGELLRLVSGGDGQHGAVRPLLWSGGNAMPNILLRTAAKDRRFCRSFPALFVVPVPTAGAKSHVCGREAPWLRAPAPTHAAPTNFLSADPH